MKAARLMLTCGGLGNLRPTPGTYASLPPIAIALLLASTLGSESRWMIDATLGLLALWGGIVCVRFGSHAEEIFQRKDPNNVVSDEVSGQSIALLFLPWSGVGDTAHNLLMASIAFVAFRVFDIVKPPPAFQFQRLQGGWGIVLDDVVAGVYAGIVTHAVVRLWL